MVEPPLKSAPICNYRLVAAGAVGFLTYPSGANQQLASNTTAAIFSIEAGSSLGARELFIRRANWPTSTLGPVGLRRRLYLRLASASAATQERSRRYCSSRIS